MYSDYNYYQFDVLSDVKIIEPDVFNDQRGSLYTTFLKKEYESFLPKNTEFVHDKFAFSKKNVLRGIHGDYFSWKLVTCVKGKIFQVIVDNRPESKTFFKHESIILDSSKPKSVLIPPGFGNAFLVLSSDCVYSYKLAYNGKYRDAQDQFTLKWNNPEININWPLSNPILSKRDSNAK